MNTTPTEIDDPSAAAPASAPARESAPGRFPLRAWVALVAMLVVVGGAGYLLYDRLFAGSADSRDLVDIVPMRGGGGGMFGGPRVEVDGVRETGRNSYTVRAGDARVAARQSKPGEWTFTFTYQRRDLVTAEQDAALTARFRLPRDAAFAKSLNVTPEQIKQLEAIPGREGMIVTDADRARLASLFDAYVKAAPPRPSETGALLAALREIA